MFPKTNWRKQMCVSGTDDPIKPGGPMITATEGLLQSINVKVTRRQKFSSKVKKLSQDINSLEKITMASLKFLFIFVILVIFVIKNNAAPAEDTKEVQKNDGEMMDTAESQNPFLPRFAMKKLKERREQARAERRNQTQRRNNVQSNHQEPYRHPDCPHRRYY